MNGTIFVENNGCSGQKQAGKQNLRDEQPREDDPLLRFKLKFDRINSFVNKNSVRC